MLGRKERRDGERKKEGRGGRREERRKRRDGIRWKEKKKETNT